MPVIEVSSSKWTPAVAVCGCTGVMLFLDSLENFLVERLTTWQVAWFNYALYEEWRENITLLKAALTGFIPSVAVGGCLYPMRFLPSLYAISLLRQPVFSPDRPFTPDSFNTFAKGFLAGLAIYTCLPNTVANSLQALLMHRGEGGSHGTVVA